MRKGHRSEHTEKYNDINHGTSATIYNGKHTWGDMQGAWSTMGNVKQLRYTGAKPPTLQDLNANVDVLNFTLYCLCASERGEGGLGQFRCLRDG